MPEKMRGQRLAPILWKAELPARQTKTLANQLRDRPRGVHARPELGVVVAATTQRAHQGHHVFRPIGEMLGQPFTEQVFHFPGQT